MWYSRLVMLWVKIVRAIAWVLITRVPTLCDRIVVATQSVRLFILSTNLRIFTARCLYLGFCHACKIDQFMLASMWVCHTHNLCSYTLFMNIGFVRGSQCVCVVKVHEREWACVCVWVCVCVCADAYITWFSSSAGLILANREKSIRVSCLAISSGSKSKIVNKAEVGWAGNYKHTKCEL